MTADTPQHVIAEAIWANDPFRMGDPDTWTAIGDQYAYLIMADATLAALKAAGYELVKLPEPGVAEFEETP